MKIKLLYGFRGKETSEKYYEAGEVVDFPPELATRLIANRQAVEIVEPQQEVTPDKPKGKVKK